MSTMINVSVEVKNRIKQHIKEGETFEDVLIRLLDLDDQYKKAEPMEFEVVFDDELIKVFKLDDTQFEYFTPARKFSISLVDWNLPDEFKEDWINFATNDDVVSALHGLGDNILECGCFMIRQI